MTLQDAFLHDILANPTDDAVRLIYADWLQEEGGPGAAARAEFIRLQIRLEGLPETAPHFPEWAAQAATLLRQHERAWLAPGRAALRQWTFRRGFLNEVTAAIPAFVENAGPLLDREPVFRARYQNPAAHLRLLANSPLVGRVGVAVLSYGYLNDAAARVLAESPHLAGLGALLLDHNFIRNAGAEALAQSPHLGRLTLLDLRGNQLGTASRQSLRDRFGDAVCF